MGYTTDELADALFWQMNEKNKPPKRPIWLVWKIRLPSGESALRAVTDTKELAIIYAENTKRDEARDGSKFIVNIEERDLNHHYASNMMKNLIEWDRDRSV